MSQSCGDSKNIKTRKTKLCDECNEKSKLTVFDINIRSYCEKHIPNVIEIGNCYVCGRPSSSEWIYRVGFGESEENTIDQYYATCGETHYKKIDTMIQKM